MEAIARKRAGAITKSAASPAAKGLNAWQLRRSPIALGAVEIRRYCLIVYTLHDLRDRRMTPVCNRRGARRRLWAEHWVEIPS